MSLTLDGLALPIDLLWLDEFDYTPIKQVQTYTLTGALVFETGQKLKGRLITLTGGDNFGWATKAQLDALYAKLTISTPLTLVLPDSRTFSVRFNHEEKPIDAKPIVDYRLMDAGDFYSLIIRLIEV